MANRTDTIITLLILLVGLVLTGCTIQTPPELAEATSSGNINKVQSMLEENPKLINSKSKRDGDTLLHWAVQGGNKELVELLVANGANVNVKNNRNHATPLCEIAGIPRLHTENHREIAKFLIANGANIKNCKYFLHRVLVRGWYDVAKLTIDEGIDVNAKDAHGNTPLHFANNVRDNIEFTEFLIARGADVNAKNKDGITPLSRAIKNGHNDIADLLRKHGAIE